MRRRQRTSTRSPSLYEAIGPLQSRKHCKKIPWSFIRTFVKAPLFLSSSYTSYRICDSSVSSAVDWYDELLLSDDLKVLPLPSYDTC